MISLDHKFLQACRRRRRLGQTLAFPTRALVEFLRELAPTPGGTAASFVGQVSDLIRLFTTIFGRFAASIGIDSRHAAQRAHDGLVAISSRLPYGLAIILPTQAIIET